MFVVEAIGYFCYTCTISDYNEKKIKEWINAHKNDDELEYLNNQERIIKAIEELGIDLYEECVESDFCTDEVRWSEFENSSAEEILERNIDIE